MITPQVAAGLAGECEQVFAADQWPAIVVGALFDRFAGMFASRGTRRDGRADQDVADNSEVSPVTRLSVGGRRHGELGQGAARVAIESQAPSPGRDIDRVVGGSKVAAVPERADST